MGVWGFGVCVKCSGPVTESGRSMHLCVCMFVHVCLCVCVCVCVPVCMHVCVGVCVFVMMSECLMESHEEKYPTFQWGVAVVESCQNQAIFAV